MFSLVMENSCSRQLEFWACQIFFNQFDCFVRHAWFALPVSLVMENSCSRQFFEVIQLSLDNRIADWLVWWWKVLAQGSWNFELVQLFLDMWIVDWFVRHIWYAINYFFFRGCCKVSLNFELVHMFLIN